MQESERSYTLCSTAWERQIWAVGENDALKDKLYINIGSTPETPDQYCEAHLLWFEFHRRERWAVKLTIFGESWWALPQLNDILAVLPRDPTPQEVIASLATHGFKPSEYHGQKPQHDRQRDRMEFDRLCREHPEWLVRVGDAS